jgi:hypothetical protein
MYFVVQGGQVGKGVSRAGVYLATHTGLRFETRAEAEAAARARYPDDPWIIVDAEHARDAFLGALRTIGRAP